MSRFQSTSASVDALLPIRAVRYRTRAVGTIPIEYQSSYDFRRKRPGQARYTQAWTASSMSFSWENLESSVTVRANNANYQSLRMWLSQSCLYSRNIAG